MEARIDIKLTGLKIKKYILKEGYDVKCIQMYLGLACPQSIYKWFRGESLPSVEHLHKLSKLFNVHMEDLLVIIDTGDGPAKKEVMDAINARKKKSPKTDLELLGLEHLLEYGKIFGNRYNSRVMR